MLRMDSSTSLALGPSVLALVSAGTKNAATGVTDGGVIERWRLRGYLAAGAHLEAKNTIRRGGAGAALCDTHRVIAAHHVDGHRVSRRRSEIGDYVTRLGRRYRVAERSGDRGAYRSSTGDHGAIAG